MYINPNPAPGLPGQPPPPGASWGYQAPPGGGTIIEELAPMEKICAAAQQTPPHIKHFWAHYGPVRTLQLAWGQKSWEESIAKVDNSTISGHDAF